jgi:predicted NAD/FAD-dependent oxidoreductase
MNSNKHLLRSSDDDGVVFTCSARWKRPHPQDEHELIVDSIEIVKVVVLGCEIPASQLTAEQEEWLIAMIHEAIESDDDMQERVGRDD